MYQQFTNLLKYLAWTALFFTPTLFAADEPKGEVELVYVEWTTEVASTNVVKVVLENQGYEVKITPVSAAAMWQAVGSDDADGMVAGWLPTLHAHYLKAMKDKVEDLGPNLKGTKSGLVVPAYVTIDNIEDLSKNAEKFGGKIIGIDPGAGIMSTTEKVLEKYNLDDTFDLIEGSDATMIAMLADAIKNEKWIVVTGWTPHWKFSRWELKYLQDPKNVYGGEEEIRTVVRKGLKEEKPEVYAILDNFAWTIKDVNELMVWNRSDGTLKSDPYQNAKRWVNEHSDKVAQWLPN
jgi:glycine betaine/proline transport system substrate-binding protein